MATLSNLVAAMATPAVSAQHEGRRHLQRLIRKVRLVLIVKHCIDDLKAGIRLRHARDPLLQKTTDILDELPNGPIAFTDFSRFGIAIDPLRCNDGSPKLQCRKGETWLKSVGDELNANFPSNKGLKFFEAHLDRYIARTCESFSKFKPSVINKSRDLWIRWSRKRGASVQDTRSQAILVRLLGKEDEGTGQLYILQRYLEAYASGSFSYALESLGEVVSRLRAVFGVGWFFEWPSGRHPLNSTWPWADVKPSLLVLWGVCWMFYPVEFGGPHIPQHSQFQQHQYRNTNYTRYRLPAQQIHSSQPVDFMDYSAGDETLLPSEFFATQQPRPFSRQTRPMQGTNMPWASQGIGLDAGRISSTAFETQTHSVALPGAASPTGFPQYLHRGDVPNYWNSRSTTRNVAECSLWLSQPSEPYALGENSVFIKAATPPINTRPSHHPSPLYTSASSASALMPSTTAFSNYPPLDTVSEMHDPRAPYMVEQERAYNQLSDPSSYDHHHDPHQEQPRYPSPPPPLSENPYNAQQTAGETPDSRMEMPMEQKSESDAPSPGRSKPVPKPDREVTKDANGRFYCSWPGCTEDVKDFGRKCEWSKHMDKHDRPYKCPADGCEKLPGFTYSGGLLRHEREVHNKHGGPRKQLNCPHPNCKRHTGKGFSRQENLNEHLRRVHTDTGLPLNGEETEDDANDAQAGGKRKRTRGDSADLREEMKRLKQENEELRRQAEAQTVQSAEMMRQIMQLQQAQQLQASMQHPRMQAPPAQMT